MGSRPAEVMRKRPISRVVPKRFLAAADDAVVVMRVAFEIEDGVDDVLDELGAGEDAFLGDVADEADGGAGGLGEVDQFGAAIAKLGDAAGGRGVGGVVDHLDGVDDREGGAEAADGAGDFFEVGFGEDFELRLAEAEAAGAQLGLLGGFFAGDVEDVRGAANPGLQLAWEWRGRRGLGGGGWICRCRARRRGGWRSRGRRRRRGRGRVR